MLEDRLRELGDASAWRVESLRVTAFPSPTTRLDDTQWWPTVFGQPAETRVSRPRLAGYQEAGPFERGKAILTVAPARIDWHFAPVEPVADADPVALLNVGSLSEAIPPFFGIMSRWLPLAPDLQRLAFGATILLPSADAPDAYKHLQRLIPSVRIDGRSSDLLYQINRPRASRSGIANIQINRLSKWSVGLLQRVLLSVTPTGVQQIMQEANATTVIRLELDTNTAPSFVGNLPRERLSEILDELADLAVEIAIRGDIP
jgi:hypothetical protein